MFDVEIEDVLTSTSTESALSANMGRVLKGLIDDLDIRIENLEGNSTTIRIWA